MAILVALALMVTLQSWAAVVSSYPLEQDLKELQNKLKPLEADMHDLERPMRAGGGHAARAAMMRRSQERARRAADKRRKAAAAAAKRRAKEKAAAEELAAVQLKKAQGQCAEYCSSVKDKGLCAEEDKLCGGSSKAAIEGAVKSEIQAFKLESFGGKCEGTFEAISSEVKAAVEGPLAEETEGKWTWMETALTEAVGDAAEEFCASDSDDFEVKFVKDRHFLNPMRFFDKEYPKVPVCRCTGLVDRLTTYSDVLVSNAEMLAVCPELSDLPTVIEEDYEVPLEALKEKGAAVEEGDGAEASVDSDGYDEVMQLAEIIKMGCTKAHDLVKACAEKMKVADSKKTVVDAFMNQATLATLETKILPGFSGDVVEHADGLPEEAATQLVDSGFTNPASCLDFLSKRKECFSPPCSWEKYLECVKS